MNILFFYINEIIPQAGGVENVTAFWQNFFKSKGNTVHIIFFAKHPTLDADIEQAQLPNEKHLNCEENISFIKNYITNNKIDIVINQIALSPRLSYVCNVACAQTKVRLISVIHNTPDVSVKARPFIRKVSSTTWGASIVYSIWRLIELCLGKYGGRFQYRISEKVIVLSPSYISIYKKINADCNIDKVMAIPNPLTIEMANETYKKENIVLFVGRLSAQKAVHRLLEVWSIVQETDIGKSWKLLIVGDGEERGKLNSILETKKLQNVKFVGWRNPTEYYEKAKIFSLTSEYEGFPMTLIECLHFGVVPIVFDSFSAAHDIIKTPVNGYIIDAFKIKEYAMRLANLMLNTQALAEMSNACMKEARYYSISVIGREWLKIIN